MSMPGKLRTAGTSTSAGDTACMVVFAGPIAVVFDVYGTLLRMGERRHPFRQLMKLLRDQGRQPRADDAPTLMTHNVGLAGAAALFNAQLCHSELALLERDLYVELASTRAYEDSLAVVEKLKAAGLKVALCSNLAAPYAVATQLLLPEFDAYGGASKSVRSSRNRRFTGALRRNSTAQRPPSR